MKYAAADFMGQRAKSKGQRAKKTAQSEGPFLTPASLECTEITEGHNQIRSTKSEIRNNNKTTMSKILNNLESRGLICFEFRYSNSGFELAHPWEPEPRRGVV